jgi:multisubunit Na+/H+ antiporter MnhF subunit
MLQILSLILIGSAVLLSLLRMLLGPTTHDRVVAADTIGVITTAGIVWIASYLNNEIYLDIALVYGALAFIGVVAIARALDSVRQGERE